MNEMPVNLEEATSIITRVFANSPKLLKEVRITGNSIIVVKVRDKEYSEIPAISSRLQELVKEQLGELGVREVYIEGLTGKERMEEILQILRSEVSEILDVGHPDLQKVEFSKGYFGWLLMQMSLYADNNSGTIELAVRKRIKTILSTWHQKMPHIWTRMRLRNRPLERSPWEFSG